MSRTIRSKEIARSNWHFKRHPLKDFQASCITDFNGDMFGYTPKSRHTRAHLISAYDDKVPAAVHEVRWP